MIDYRNPWHPLVKSGVIVTSIEYHIAMHLMCHYADYAIYSGDEGLRDTEHLPVLIRLGEKTLRVIRKALIRQKPQREVFYVINEIIGFDPIPADDERKQSYGYVHEFYKQFLEERLKGAV